MALAAAVAYIISTELREVEISLFFISYCSLVCGLTGFAIGWTFPEEYRRRKKADVTSHDRRIQPRISVFSTGTLLVGKEKYPCQTVDLSLEGAKLTTATSEDIGTNVILNLNDIGVIDGVIRRKEEKKTYLQFLPSDETRKRLEAYIGLYSASPAFA